MKFETAKAIEILHRTPLVLHALLGFLSDEWTESRENPDDWEPFDIVGHLIEGEQNDWIARAELILAQGPDRTFEPFDRLAQFENSKNKTLDELLDTFAELRQKNLETLGAWNLTEEQLDLKAAHPALGEVTLRQLLSTWVVHDLTHLRQLAVVLARKYAPNVGPWKEYLSILKQ
ncbi:MAG: DinB family protein [Acidobacteria bacterium]|nr:DinB family protein [Acidobacteriota bacterium]